jgi:Xaa-Pro aminopeptidase
LLLDPKRVTLGLREQVRSASVVEATNPSTLAKSRKTADEAAQVREAMAEDGAAMCEFYAWFEAALARGDALDELIVDERLSAARARRAGFVGLSFPVIAGFNANGAMPHYRATQASYARIEGDGLLLIDSGGQYLGGTTDITRVWPIGNVSAEMKTRLHPGAQGHAGAVACTFPARHAEPDARRAGARAAVGGKPGLRPRHRPRRGLLPERARRPAEHQQGSAESRHGDAAGHDHLDRARPVPTRPVGRADREPGAQRAAGDNEFGEFLAFETLTLCPIDTRCIERSLLRADEIAWLNAYHATVRERLAPRSAATRWPGWKRARSRSEPVTR